MWTEGLLYRSKHKSDQRKFGIWECVCACAHVLGNDVKCISNYVLRSNKLAQYESTLEEAFLQMSTTSHHGNQVVDINKAAQSHPSP